jgi:hypothetical protein
MVLQILLYLNMSVGIYEENMAEALGRRDFMETAVETILRRDMDVCVLTDSHSVRNPKHNEIKGSDPEYFATAEERFKSEGYTTVLDTPYGDEDNWHHDRNLVVMSRLPVEFEGAMQIGHRRSIKIVVADPETNVPLTVVGMHGDDRNEQPRVDQAIAVPMLIPLGSTAVLALDANNLYRSDPKARFLRGIGAMGLRPAARIASERLPQKSKLQYRADQARRLFSFAEGRMLEILTSAQGLKDADPAMQGTVGPFQLDHILYTPESVSVRGFRVEDPTNYSGHRAVSVVATAERMPVPELQIL